MPFIGPFVLVHLRKVGGVVFLIFILSMLESSFLQLLHFYPTFPFYSNIEPAFAALCESL